MNYDNLPNFPKDTHFIHRTNTSLLDVLNNSMEHYNEQEFVKSASEFGLSEDNAKKVFSNYWKVDPLDRNNWTYQWKRWLNELIVDDNGNTINNVAPNVLETYLNNWFRTNLDISKSNRILTDEIITVKKCDQETAEWLHHTLYNTVRIKIMGGTVRQLQQNQIGENLYEMLVCIDSCDDMCYGIWWEYDLGNQKPIGELMDIRDKLVAFIDDQKEINGQSILNFCIQLGGANEFYS